MPTYGLYLSTLVHEFSGIYVRKLSKNISQQTISKDLNISRATISNFESGTSSDIGLKKVLQIVDYLGYEINLKEKSAFPIFEDVING